MNDTTKKVLVIVIAVVALGLAIWQGMGFVGGPTETKKIIAVVPPGKGMKASEKAEEEAAAKGQAASKPDQGDPLAGPNPK